VALGLLHGGQLLDSLSDDVEAFPQLGLGDDERRGETDDVAVRGFGLLDILSIEPMGTEGKEMGEILSTYKKALALK
jgi:hypothetical protein